MIHKIQVPTDNYSVVLDASAWLQERLGCPPWMRKFSLGSPQVYDFDRLESEDHYWDAYVDPSTFEAFFRIKDHPDIALLFKLTFGGTNANQ